MKLQATLPLQGSDVANSLRAMNLRENNELNNEVYSFVKPPLTSVPFVVGMLNLNRDSEAENLRHCMVG